MYFDRDKIKQQLLEFTIQTVEKFLKEHPELEFYAFAYDCFARYAQVGLCFNTIEEFDETLQRSQEHYPQYSQTAEQINEIKYCMGGWEFQGFDMIFVQQIDDIYDQLPEDDEQSKNEFIESVMILFSEAILEFTQTDTYKAIPKTQDFIAYAMDHDENFTDIIPRMLSLTSHTFVDAQLKYAELDEKFKTFPLCDTQDEAD